MINIHRVAFGLYFVALAGLPLIAGLALIFGRLPWMFDTAMICFAICVVITVVYIFVGIGTIFYDMLGPSSDAADHGQRGA